MDVKANLNNLRMSPRKVRLVVGLVRGKTVAVAREQLRFCSKWSAEPVAKLLTSAVANAKNNFGLAEDNLYIKSISVDGGPTLKRWLPRAHGRATPLKKRSSHINLVLGEIKESATAPVAKTAVDSEVKLETVKLDEVKENKVEKTKPKNNGPLKPGQTDGSAKRGFAGKMFQRKSG